MNLQAFLDWLKPKLVHATQSVTMWYGGALAALPEVLAYAKDNFKEVAEYIPHQLQTPALHWIGLGVLLCRFRSLGKPK